MEIDNEKKEDIYEIICEVIVKACQLESSPEMVSDQDLYLWY